MAVPSNWPQSIRAAGGYYHAFEVFNDEPFVQPLVFEGEDYTAATFSGGVRAAFEASSAVLESFTFGTATLVGGNTHVTVSLLEADVESLRDGDDPGAVETLFYNIKITPSGGSKATNLAGEFKLMGA